jgi:hypothetical protein
LTATFLLDIHYSAKTFNTGLSPVTIDRSQIPTTVPISPFTFTPACTAAVWTYTATGLPPCATFDPVTLIVDFPIACYAALTATLYSITITGTLNTGETP